MTTLLEVKNGTKLPRPIYQEKPYIILSNENVVLFAGTLEEVKQQLSYYDDCTVDIRRHDLHMNDNTKIGWGGKRPNQTGRPKKDVKLHPHRISFDNATWAELEQMSLETGLPIAELVRRAVDKFLKH